MVTRRRTDPTRAPLVAAELNLIGGLTERFFGLLAAIDATGSITRAARRAGLSYKGAWEMLDRANNLSPQILVFTQTGGRQGGGASLTPAGSKLLALFRRVQTEHRRFLDQLNADLLDDPELRDFVRRLVMGVSARNQLLGRIQEIRSTLLDIEVGVAIKGGIRITATMSRTAAEELALRPGQEVLALIKSHEVTVIGDREGLRFSARNQISGRVERLLKGSVNSDLVLRLPGGEALAATLTNESLEPLGLEPGDAATALFKAGAVIIGAAAEPEGV